MHHFLLSCHGEAGGPDLGIPKIWVPHLRRVLLRLRWAFALSANHFLSRICSKRAEVAIQEAQTTMSQGHPHDLQPQSHLSTSRQIRRCPPDQHLPLASAIYPDV